MDPMSLQSWTDFFNEEVDYFVGHEMVIAFIID